MRKCLVGLLAVLAAGLDRAGLAGLGGFWVWVLQRRALHDVTQRHPEEYQ